MVVDCGEKSCTVLPVSEAYALPHAVRTTKIGGSHLDDYFKPSIFGDWGQTLNNKQRLCLCDVKVKAATVAISEDKYESISEYKYTLPDNSEVIISGETRGCCGELFFNPPSAYETTGIQEQCLASVNACDDVEIHRDLVANLVLSGGTSLLPGFHARFTAEMSRLIPAKYKVKVLDQERTCRHSAWVGGSILASLLTFQQMWISKAEYDESGPSIVHRKCF